MVAVGVASDLENPRFVVVLVVHHVDVVDAVATQPFEPGLSIVLD